jgi:hypothetical protein
MLLLPSLCINCPPHSCSSFWYDLTYLLNLLHLPTFLVWQGL